MGVAQAVGVLTRHDEMVVQIHLLPHLTRMNLTAGKDRHMR